MIKDAFFPLSHYGVYFDARVLDAESLLARIKKALPFLKNNFETTVLCGGERRPIKIRIIGRVKEGSHEKLVQQYNQFRATLSADLLASKKFRELHCRFTLFARDTLNAFDVFEELAEEASSKPCDHEGLELSRESANASDLKADKIILFEKRIETKKRRFSNKSGIQFHPVVYTHEIERIETLPKKSRHQLARHLTRAKECLKRKAYDDAFEIFQDLKPYRVKYKP